MHSTPGHHEQLRAAWQKGERRLIEEKLSESQWTSLPEAQFLDLIYGEYLARHALGEKPDEQEYQKRFPIHSAAIARLFELHRLLGESVTLQTANPFRPAGDAATLAGDQVTVDSARNDQVPVPGAKLRGFGNYELLEEIARGGMGVVYKARQTKLSRVVALKMILSGQFASAGDIERFRSEAEAAAQLDHPAIVPVYEVGERDGLHYFSMGYVDGIPLSARLQKGPLPPREAATLMRTLAEAVQYAHEKGVIHRDLKPGNILLDQSGQPRITDFGLAKRTSTDANLTTTGQILGTPSYMPPEQAVGQSELVREAADVYALGAVLYATLTGRPPFQAANILETLRQVREEPPVKPRLLDAEIPLDLQSICLKCLEKKPENRYASAAALANDLARFLAGDAVEARPQGIAYATLAWVRANLRSTVTAGLVGLVFGVLLGLSSLSWSMGLNTTNEVAMVYESFPSLHRPAFPINYLLEFRQDTVLMGLLGIGFLALVYLGLPAMGAAIHYIARPKDLQGDVAAGAVAGVLGGAAAFMCGFGWTAVNNATVTPLLDVSREMRLLSPDVVRDPSQQSLTARTTEVLEHLASRHPELQPIEPERRIEAYLQQSAVQLSARALWGVSTAIFWALFAGPLIVTVQTVFLGTLERRAAAMLSTAGMSPRAREIVDHHLAAMGKWQTWWSFVGVRYAGFAVFFTFLSLLIAGMITTIVPAMLLNGLTLNGMPLVSLPAVALLFVVAWVCWRSSRQLVQIQLALLKENVEALGEHPFFFVVCTLPGPPGAMQPNAVPGFLIVSDDVVRFVGRTMNGQRQEREFHPSTSNVQLRCGWRPKITSRQQIAQERRNEAIPGVLSFSIDVQDASDRCLFYAVPMLSPVSVAHAVWALTPPENWGSGRDIAEAEVLWRKYLETTSLLPPAPKSSAPLTGKERTWQTHRIANKADQATLQAYEAVLRTLREPSPTAVSADPTETEPNANPFKAPVAASAVGSSAVSASAAAVITPPRPQLFASAAHKPTSPYLVATAVVAFCLLCAGEVAILFVPPPGRKQVGTTTGYLLIKRGANVIRESPWGTSSQRIGDEYVRAELPADWQATYSKYGTSVRDASGKLQFGFSIGEILNVQHITRRLRVEFGIEVEFCELEGRQVAITRHEHQGSIVGKDARSVKMQVREVVYYTDNPGRTSLMFSIPIEQADELEPFTWEILKTVSVKSPSEVQPSELPQYEDVPDRWHSAKYHVAIWYGIALGGICLGSLALLAAAASKVHDARLRSESSNSRA